MSTLVPAELLAIMQCPACAAGLEENPEPPSLLCQGCGLRYPVIDGIPSMLVDEATPTRNAPDTENPPDQPTPDQPAP